MIDKLEGAIKLDSDIYTLESSELQEQVAKELLIPDPEDKNVSTSEKAKPSK